MQKTQIEKGENAFCSWSKTKKSIVHEAFVALASK